MPTFREDIRLGTKVPQMKTEDYEDASVTTEKIADKAVTEGKLAEHAVTSSILGNGAVESTNIKDGSITNEKMANRTIKAFEKITRGSISEEEMGSFSVGNDELIDGSVTTEKIDDEAVVIEKIAAEVWNKLKDEYLRRDGSNFMQSNLGLNDHNIIGVKEIRNISALPVVIAFNKDGYNVKFEQWSTSGGDEGASPDFIGGFNGGELEVPLNITAAGFKTKDLSTLGLLNNNSEVVTAMTDSDIDSCIAGVFG